MTLFITTIIFLVIISILVFFHELGHFLAAKWSGIDVHQFAIGFGPAIYAKKFKGTEYKICVIPMGGYVQIEGEEDSDNPKGFRNKPFYIKLFVLSAGVIMNVIVAIFAFQLHLSFNNYQLGLPNIVEYQFTNIASVNSVYPIIVTDVIENGNSEGQLFVGDQIVGINGERFASQADFLRLISENQNSTAEFEFFDFDTFLTTRRDIEIKERNDENSGILEVRTVDLNVEFNAPTYFIVYKEDAFSPFAITWDMTVFQINAIGALFNTAFETGDYSQVSNAVGGPIQVGSTVGEVVENGVYQTLFFLTGAISLSLAIFNILPFPALDGGQIAISAYESITRKKLKDSTLNMINMIGFGFLIILSILVAIKDIVQLNVIDSIASFFSQILGR